jgi:2-hydroxychromene-2-carboxylate isomerase
MTSRTVRFYFAYNSPYAFLANTRITTVLSPSGATLVYRPVYSPRTGGGPDITSSRLRYMFEDVVRFAEAYGLQLDPGPFADTRQACLGFLYAEAEGKGCPYHDAVYAARHLQGRDIGATDTLAEIAAGAGLERAAFLAALDDPRWEAALAASNADAERDEVFGFPTFVYSGKRFWGNDRIEWLVREIERGG